MQVFYSLIAILLVALLSMTVQRTAHRLNSQIYINEVVTQASGVGTATLEAIALRPFDSKTDTMKVATIPAVTSAAQLTPEAEFGGCIIFNTCEDIDDFSGMTITREYDGFEFTVVITVRYVDALNPDVYTSSQTYAKEVLVEITNPYIYVGSSSNPITVPFRRIFSYQKVTSI